MNINNPKKLPVFITIPQCILAVLLGLAFIQAKELPDIQLIIMFVLECLINMAVIVYYIQNKDREKVELRALYTFLLGFLVIFSYSTVMIFEQFSSTSVISIETLYLLCNSVSMIYLCAAIIKQADQEKELSLSALIALCLALPVAVYLLLQSTYSLGDISLVLAIGLVCVFLFLLAKLVYVLYAKRKKPVQTGDEIVGYSHKYRIFVFISAVLLPQVGLAVNNYMFWGGIIGDFASIWFYSIAAVNGMLLLVDINKTKYKLSIFYLKTVGFSFICYFTLIFIPYMPYAIIGIVFYGFGLLVYVPATVFIVQIKQMYRELRLLNNCYQKQRIIIVVIAGFLTLPILLTINFQIDRLNFDRAMAYVNPTHTIQKEVNISRLNRSISQIENTMVSARESEGLAFSSGTPIISTVYRYVSLNNMFFTEDTLEKLRKIFIPETIVSAFEVMQSAPEPNQNFNTKLSVSVPEYEAASGTYKAWVDFEMKQVSNSRSNEYKTKFTLPDGCFITDYYLYVGSEKKRGIMTDKRAALAAYERIIRTPKDPGIIYYDTDNTISLRVFPFNGSETRKTGFQVMYSQNETLTIEGQTIYLEAEKPLKEPMDIKGVQFIPAEYKKALPALEREPLYYFLLDAGNGASYPKHLELVKQYIENRNIHNPKYYAVSYQAKELTDPTSGNPQVVAKGGFNTAYAMEEIFQSVPDGSFPIVMLVTENMNRSVPLEKTRLAKAFPEVDCYYRLNSYLTLTPYDFSRSERLPDVREPFIIKALDYHGTAIRDDGKSETILTSFDLAEYADNPYKNAFILQKNTSISTEDKVQVSQIKESIRQRILTKNTAFMVMETKAQEDMLLSIQDKFLKGESVETPSVMMSESGWIVIIAILGIVMILRYKFAERKNIESNGKVDS